MFTDTHLRTVPSLTLPVYLVFRPICHSRGRTFAPQQPQVTDDLSRTLPPCCRWTSTTQESEELKTQLRWYHMKRIRFVGSIPVRPAHGIFGRWTRSLLWASNIWDLWDPCRCCWHSHRLSSATEPYFYPHLLENVLQKHTHTHTRAGAPCQHSGAAESRHQQQLFSSRGRSVSVSVTRVQEGTSPKLRSRVTPGCGTGKQLT